MCRPVIRFTRILHSIPIFWTIERLALVVLLAVSGFNAGCSTDAAARSSRERRAAQGKVSAETMEYLRAFSHDQQECLRAMHESSPQWGRHKEALDYGKFLNQRAPRVLQIVEQNLPSQERVKFQESRGGVEANVKAAEEENESEAAGMEGGTLATLLRHHGTIIAMRIRIGSLEPWIPYLPAVLQPEMRAICERTEKW